MIGCRLLPPAEEEMTEVALYYEAARSGFGDIFLDDIQHAIDAIRERPEIGARVAYGFRRAWFAVSLSAFSTLSKPRPSLSWPCPTSAVAQSIGRDANDC